MAPSPVSVSTSPPNYSNSPQIHPLQLLVTNLVELQVEVVTDANVNYTEEALVPLLELALVEDLHRNDGVLLHGTIDSSAQYHGGPL